MNKKINILLNYLEKNQDKWVSTKELNHLLGKDKNNLRSWVYLLHKNSVWIVYNKKLGYKLTTNSNEIKEFCIKKIKDNLEKLLIFKNINSGVINDKHNK